MKNPTYYSSLVILALLAAITLLFFWRITFSGMILARGDVYSYFYPLWDVRSAAFRAGHIPLWSPDIFMGVPLLANSQLGTFYPPNWLVTPFDAPTAITLSLLAHTFWAMLGVYLLTRRTLALDRISALLAGVVFGLGGYLGGQSEHINQLQALSWMPWLFLIVSYQSTVISQQLLATSWRRYQISLLRVLIFGVSVALQLLAGHPQTVFITLVGLSLFALTKAVNSRQSPVTSRFHWRLSFNMYYLIRFVLLIVFGSTLGLVLAAPQLVPTLELAGLGNRGGGLDPQKVLAFSFTPLLIGRGMLPSYDGLLFGEYIAYSGVIGLGLAIIGVFSHQSPVASRQQEETSYKSQDASQQSVDDGRNLVSDSALGIQHSVLPTLPFLLLIIVGFFFALGAFNPLNWVLASLPGFSFFRVPARWMALEALGAAALAGVGLQSLKYARPRLWVLGLVVIITAGLAGASTLAGKQAVDVIGPAVPTLRSWIGWGVALAALLMLIVGRRWLGAARIMVLITAAAVLELFLAAQIMPINLTAPKDVYSASRFAIRQLQVLDAEQTPPGRLLSISPLEFDPGDKDALNARYTDLGMDALSTRIALVATKLREVVGPNLGMKWGIPSIDGFDGGLLPTRYYTAFSSLLLPEGSDPSTDGRLREMLALPECRGACIPEQRWLNLSNTRYLITDKTADVVQDGIFYDTSLELTREKNQLITIRNFPAFEADAIDLLCRDAGGCFADVTFNYADGTSEKLKGVSDFSVQTYSAFRLKPITPRSPVSITINPGGDTRSIIRLSAVTLLDTRAKVFQQVALPPWKRILSSDIKLYENTNVTPRAYFASAQDVKVAADTTSALTLMRSDVGTDVASAFVIGDYPVNATDAQPPNESAAVNIVSYSAERIEIRVNTGDQAGLLVLSDAYYPGWTATVNSEPTHIYRTNIMFRGVPVPKGESTVIFEFHPWWWPVIPLLGLAAWLAVGLVGMWRVGKKRSLL
ncbi:MAG: YfhO family protein [Anaerolineaceae bacterium]|nr:YfhO family protein [Anaerolineaceae bacterium]